MVSEPTDTQTPLTHRLRYCDGRRGLFFDDAGFETMRNRIPPPGPDELDHPLNALTGDIIDAAGLVRKELGAGLVERSYRTCLAAELRARGRDVQQEVELPVAYRGSPLGLVYRVDLVVDGTVLVELKAVQELHPLHLAQTLTYLRHSGLPLALLLNFNAIPFKAGIRRFIARQPA